MKVLKIQFFSISTPHILELSHIFQIFTWAAHFLILSISVLFFFFFTFSSVQSLSRVWFLATPRTAAHQASLSISNSLSLLKLMSIESVMPSNHLTLCHPLLLLPSIFTSIRVFANWSVLCIMRFSFSICPSNEYSGLISFRMDWFDLLAVQGTLKNLFQHRSSKASILWCSVSLWSNPHIHTWVLEKP